ncbi:flavin reductase family protein [Sneathiella sp.]|uniref:flavin reductase family protein n=1 Tax=Sneathiella sp. TaxID=1964365 RepID=UPI00356AC1FF
MQEVSPDLFKHGMRHLAATVNVISVMCGDEPRGMLATAVCSVCADPPTLLICINRSASMYSAIQDTGRFCVNVLDQRQFDTACHFMSQGASERFTICDWDTLRTGAPAIQGALVNFDCELDSKVDVGTHTICFGRVVAQRTADEGQPLIYHDGKYAALNQTPS